MAYLTQILYILLCVTYALFRFQLFPEWNTNVIILTIPMLAVGIWVFGISRRLFVMLYLIIVSITLSQVFGDVYIYYMDRATGAVIYLTVIYLFGNLRKQYDAIMETNKHLDKRVKERDTELLAQTQQLLNVVEKNRVNCGQELHDGVGQQLTWMQFLSSSLAYQLENKNSLQAATAQMLSITTRRAHNHIRRIARTLFPVRIAQVGLLSALAELADCLIEIRPAHILFKELSDISSMPETIALQLYRICQGSCSYIIDQCKADQLELTLNTTTSEYVLGVSHNIIRPRNKQQTSILKLIQYQLKQINGKQTTQKTIHYLLQGSKALKSAST